MIEELKAAGEELKKAEQELKKTEKRPSPAQEAQEKESDTALQQDSFGTTAQESGSIEAGTAKVGTGQTPPASFPVPSVIEGEARDWVSLKDYQSSIANEKQRMREAHKKIDGLEKMVKERLETLEKIQSQTEKMTQALKELGQRIVSIKREDDTLLYQIKSFIREGEPKAKPGR